MTDGGLTDVQKRGKETIKCESFQIIRIIRIQKSGRLKEFDSKMRIDE